MNHTTAAKHLRTASSSALRLNLPALGAGHGYLLGLRTRGTAGRLGVPLMPAVGYAGKGDDTRMWRSIQERRAEFAAELTATERWDVTLPSTRPDDLRDAVLVLEAAAAQALASIGFSGNVQLTAPEARQGLLRRGIVTPGQLQQGEADARAQVRAWATARQLALPPALRGAQQAAALGIAGLAAAAAAIGVPVAAPMRLTATECQHLPAEALRPPRCLAEWAEHQADATLPGMAEQRFPGNTFHDSIARSVRHPNRMPVGLGADTCQEHGWIWVAPPPPPYSIGVLTGTGLQSHVGSGEWLTGFEAAA